MSIAKDYNINLGLTHEDIINLLSGEISTFNFVPTEDTDYNDRISISLKEVGEDSTLSEQMSLVVDNLKNNI